MKEIAELRGQMLTLWHRLRDNHPAERTEAEAILDLIDALSDRLRWRKMGEEKPEEGQRIFFCDTCYKTSYGFLTYTNSQTWRENDAWMPAPELPKDPKPELLPCPRCGKEVVILPYGEIVSELWKYLCRSCGDGADGFQTRKEAILWANRRAGK